MRLWHEELLSKLPYKQLGGQWRECLALLGNGWGKKHKTINYVFEYSVIDLIAFTILVHRESKKRGYNYNLDLIIKQVNKRISDKEYIKILFDNAILRLDIKSNNIYHEHNDLYYKECLENLKRKGVKIC